MSTLNIENLSRNNEFFSGPLMEESVAPSEEADRVLDTLVTNLETLTVEEFDKIRAGSPEYQLTHCGRGDPGYRNIVFIAALHGRMDLVTHMVSIAGKELLNLGSQGYTPLVGALVARQYDTAEKLIELGANVNVKAGKELFCLHKQGYTDLACVLPWAIQPYDVQSPLEHMAYDSLSNSETVACMLTNGARIQKPVAMCNAGRVFFGLFCTQFSAKIASVKQKEALILTVLEDELPPELGELITSYYLKRDEAFARGYIEAEAIVERRAQRIDEILLFPTPLTHLINSYDEGEGYEDARRARFAT